MGSQTLEILRQGVWASLTGGWFYDPHQNLFCNTVHLYIWLFLLCLPFSIYLYFPPASLGWVVYCGLVAILFTVLKLLNHSLHHMYDTTECIIVEPAENGAENNNCEEGVSLPMQRLGARAGGSDNESVTSIEYHKPNSTIDLKVDVHRKNSSESSVEDSSATKQPPSVAITKSDLCVPPSDLPGPSKTRPNRRSKTGHRRPSKPRALYKNRIEELSAEESARYNKNDDSLTINIDEEPYPKIIKRYEERIGSNRDFFKEWLYLDGREAGEAYQSKFARQLSSDSRDNSEPSVGPPSPKKRTSHRRRYGNYQDESFTKSAMALATQPSSMRRNSNSTMSTIQLPLLTSTAQLVSHMRRHSNNADAGFFASVELGAYMMEKTETPLEPDNPKGISPGVRRIKSAALEIGCPPPSVSNLSPHPNSAETIGGQTLKNPKSAVIPPPSKSLTRGPHLNLYPQTEDGEGPSYPYVNYGSEIVYPIAEISDEMQTSQKETDLDTSGDSYSDYDDENINMKHQFRGFDWEAEQSPVARSSDSDYENNGSRSPLLDRATEAKVVRTKVQERKAEKPANFESSGDKAKQIRLKKKNENEVKFSEVKIKIEPLAQTETLTPGDYFDKASASSKDLLIEKSSLESNENGENKKNEVIEKKPWDHEISNSSSSFEISEKPADSEVVADESSPPNVDNCQKCDNSGDSTSLCSIAWLFQENAPEEAVIENPEQIECQKSPVALAESSNVPKNLGAIPKQIKNLARSRTSSQKENKKRDKKDREDINDDAIPLDAVEAQAALVQGLECLFAATNANTVVMPNPNNPNREDRRSIRQQSIRGERENKRKKSIEEVAQQSTNTLLPTSMPLLAAFLNSRVDYPHMQVQEPTPGTSEQNPEDPQRFRPLMDRNHRNRIRKIKRSTRQRNNPQAQVEKRVNPPNLEATCSSTNVHFATSFDDTSEGAIHCFMDEHGNWMSYTFDKNGRTNPQPMIQDKDDQKKSKENDSQGTAEGSFCSLESEANNENVFKKRENSIDSNQGSNNPLLSSNNNLSTVVPINTNNANKRFYVFDGGTGDQPRSPVAYVTDSLLEQIEAERQSRMGLPSMHINFLMSQQRAQQNQQNIENAASLPAAQATTDECIAINIRSTYSKFLDVIEKAKQPKPKSYYKFKLMNFWPVKISMDRLKLMALFDRNLTFTETIVSILLAILVSVLGSLVLNMGFYRDIYAFWFCFIMAGSQYSLLKSVQPDSASPVHGFNKMVLFSRPVYFCLCTGILCYVHSQLETPEHDRFKRSTEEKFTVYGLEIDSKYFLTIVQTVISNFILFFPLSFSLGLFPQVNTFLMYFLEQIDMHIFGGNATSSLSAAVYCVLRSLAAVGVLYGFAYSGLVEGKKSQHQKHNILFSIFCGLLVPICYHLSRSASDYSLIWSVIKKHLIPPELYIVTPETAQDIEKDPTLSPEAKKHNSESNISKQNSLGSSTSKINFSSETNIAKTRKSQTSSVSSLKLDPKAESNGSLKCESVPEAEDAEETKVESDKPDDEDMEDPLPKKLLETVQGRLKNDLIVCTFLGLFVFGLHCTTVFATLRPQLNTALWILASALGWVLHYLTPQLRKQQPWLCLSSPVLKQHEYSVFEVQEQAKLMYFERIFVYLVFVERNVLFPALTLSATQYAPELAAKYGDAAAAALVSVCALKCLRNAYSEPDVQYLIVIFAVLLFQKDFGCYGVSETFLVDYFVTAIIFNKVYEFLLKVQFVVTYIAPWQITWGSAFHAFAQPFSVPHSCALLLQCCASALVCAPLAPLLGSAIFMTSYVRPVKFWERDYNTRRVDQSNTRLASQLERNLGADDNNLNSIFYEHLTRSLQHYLCGDLMLGRWGQVQQGDCFVLASDYLNCLVHIVEMGNGLVSFQLRGLEFRGTYCQQREVEAISEGPEESNDGLCAGYLCPGRLLPLPAVFSLRWLAWQLVSAKYVLEGYSVSDNSAASMLHVHDFRKHLLTYYVKSIIFYTIQSPKLDEWLSSPALCEALRPLGERAFVDLDPVFNVNLDEDYDFRASGITRARFTAVYGEWIRHCASRRAAARRRGGDPALSSLCLALSLLGRRALAAAQPLASSSVEFFLYGLHALFKGDFRITCARDEWVFTDVALLHSVLAPAIRMALKLHQDHFMFPEEYVCSAVLHAAIVSHAARLVICHEAAPRWRHAVLRGKPHLLALRHVMDEGTDDYKIIMLNKRHLGFRVIKLNRECVRGLWAGQQQELVYLRNRNPERGSIQNAKQALRNIINSSCDQPIGYPIYVSPLTTSYADTSGPLRALLGGPASVGGAKRLAMDLWRRLRRRCGEGCSSGAGAEGGPRSGRDSLDRAGTRGSLASAGKCASATPAARGQPHARDRPPDQSFTGSIDKGSPRRRQSAGAGPGTPAGGPVGPVGPGGLGGPGGPGGLAGPGAAARARRERTQRAHSAGKETRQIGTRSRLRRERARPASFRLLPDAADTQSATGSGWDSSWREQPRRAASAKISSHRPPTPDSSLEDVTIDLDDVTADCRVIANRSARPDAREMKRYFLTDSSSKELSKPSKEILHERESYRVLAGRYTERPDAAPLELTSLKPKRDLKARELGAKVKRSDSWLSDDASVSLGSKVLIVEPQGVFDCINLGRRIDVQWPSEYRRERGGRSHWGAWVPTAGMDGLVVHKWSPNHRDPKLRSHVDKSILLVQIEDKFVPIAESCVQDLGDEV